MRCDFKSWKYQGFLKQKRNSTVCVLSLHQDTESLSAKHAVTHKISYFSTSTPDSFKQEEQLPILLSHVKLQSILEGANCALIMHN